MLTKLEKRSLEEVNNLLFDTCTKIDNTTRKISQLDTDMNKIRGKGDNKELQDIHSSIDKLFSSEVRTLIEQSRKWIQIIINGD